ncbi:MAG: hypothetical protein ABEJ62_02095 [Candidatus Nanohaloarchaea archaeon]
MFDPELPGLPRGQALLVFLAAGLVIGAGLSFAAMSFDRVSKQEAGQKLVRTLEAQTGQDLELLKVEASGGLYTVDIRDSSDKVSTFYVTRDGSSATSSVVDLDRSLRLAKARNSLSSCLQERGVVMFGNLSQQETRLQVQLLGGQRYVSGIYYDVSSQQVLQQAAQLGIQRVPSIYYNGSARQGVQTPQQIAEFTGCSYGVNSSSN